jgi:hypothetical protein
MDNASENVIAFLAALTMASDRLHDYGYSLYLKTSIPWSSSRSRKITFSSVPTQAHESGPTKRVDRLYGIGFWLEHSTMETSGRTLNFAIDVTRDADRWLVKAYVEEDSYDGYLPLWSPQDCWTTTLDGVIQSLQQATEALIQSAGHPEVSNALEEYGRTRKRMSFETS